MAHSTEPLLPFELTIDAHDLHREVLAALNAAVPSELAVCYASVRDDGVRLLGSQLSSEGVVPLAPQTPDDAEPYARALLGHERALLIELRHGARVFGVAGVLGRGRPSDLLALQRIAPLLGSLVATHERCRELSKRAAEHEAQLAAFDRFPARRKQTPQTNKLSPREREIASLLVDGYAAINAAAVLDLSEHTVRTYIRRLYRKLDVKNRADLVRTLVHTAPLASS